MSIDWNDPKAIGLKYKFLNNDKVFNVESVKGYKGILYIDNIGAGRAGTNDWTKTIQLVQGYKTPYDGKGQPVPDGVMVNIYLNYKDDVVEQDASKVDWSYEAITHFQVQEMPEEIISPSCIHPETGHCQ